MGPIQLVVFDLAGTTIEDEGGMVLQSLVETAQAYELPGTPEKLNALMGMNKREVFGMLTAQLYPANEARANSLADEALANFIGRMRAAYEAHLAPMSGAEETSAESRSRRTPALTRRSVA
jgi:phosphoglycolate phosphatase-like HAD superfamily hydrolase